MSRPARYEPVSMSLRWETCWMKMTIGTATGTVDIRFSDAFDAIPKFVNWMEALTTGVMFCGFGIDEEGTEKHFGAQTAWNGRYYLKIAESDMPGAEVHFRAVIHRRQLIEEVYRGLQRFGLTKAYRESGWGRETLGQLIARKTGNSVPEIDKFMLGLDDAALVRFLHAFCPTGVYPGRFEAYLEGMKNLEEMAYWASRDDHPAATKSLAERPDLWELDGTIKRRQAAVSDFLSCQASASDGTPLDTLRSDLLEHYLGSDLDRDASGPQPVE